MWLSRLHFGRWRNNGPLEAVWAIVGLVPAIMFVTGVIMWWNRTLRPLLRRGPSFDPSLPNSEGRLRARTTCAWRSCPIRSHCPAR